MISASWAPHPRRLATVMGATALALGVLGFGSIDAGARSTGPTLQEDRASTKPAPFATVAAAQAAEPSLLPEDAFLLTTAASGLPVTPETTGGVANGVRNPDTRILHVNNLPNGPFQTTAKDFRGNGLSYDAYTEDTIHRFFQIWQQSDCAIANATPSNPTGCLNDLYPFVITTFAGQTEEGMGTSMGFYNINQGDARAAAAGPGGVRRPAQDVPRDLPDRQSRPAAEHEQRLQQRPRRHARRIRKLQRRDAAGRSRHHRLSELAALSSGADDLRTERLLRHQQLLPPFHANGVAASPAKFATTGDATEFFFIPRQTIPTIGDALNAKNVS